MQVSSQADEASLKTAYTVFKEKAQGLDRGYQPTSVNTDGWWTTQKCLEKSIRRNKSH